MTYILYFMHSKTLSYLCLLGLVFSACNPSEEKEKTPLLQTGIWRAELELQGQKLPFNFEVSEADSGQYQVHLINGEERLLIDDVVVEGDSLIMPMSFFDTQIRAQIQGEQLSGYFIKNYAEDYRLPLHATYDESYRFVPGSNQKVEDFGGKWEVQFAEDSLISVGIFEQQGNELTGSFLTTTGDYRFLEGNVEGQTMKLSTFDGEHAYLFEARKQQDGLLQGDYWSGKGFHTTWTARRNEEAKLPDANSLTFLKEGYDKVEFTFPNLEGEAVSLGDEKYQGKVVIVQLFGTWCPNCMDETRFFADWYRRHQQEDVEIIGLAYERKDDFEYASSRVKKMIEKLDVGYDFLIAGVSDKEAASKTLPMLNRVISFPTSIFIDKNGRVRNIHTGFSGPGTGIYYERFVEEFNALMEKLLAEEVNS